MMASKRGLSRRALLATLAGAPALGALAAPALAQRAPLRIGLMLPFSGTYAKLGQFIDEGVRLHAAARNNRLGGRAVSFIAVDDESDPAKANDNINRLIGRDKVDLVIGTVHSGVALAMIKRARDTGTLLLIPNAGANEATGALCAPSVWRTSFSNWQPCFPMGKVMAQAGKRAVVTITWRYAAGQQMTAAFKDGFEQNGGRIVEAMTLPFAQVEFQPLLTKIAALKPDAVFAFFAGGGAVKFVKDYAAAGLKAAVPLYGVGFLTDGLLKAQGTDAEGLQTTLHYADDLDTPANRDFQAAFARRTGMAADVYAVQGYDTAALLDIGLTAVDGDIAARAAMSAAMRAATIDSPRGVIRFSPSQNVVQNIYLREVRDGLNRFVAVAAEALADPATGCRAGP